MLTKDEYGQVHNSPETYKALAEALQDHEIIGDPQIFEWVDERMSRFILLLYLAAPPSRANYRYLYVGVENKGFYGFPTTGYISSGYVAEKLNLAGGRAGPLADLLNGVLDEFIPGRGTSVRETMVFTQEWVDGGTGPDKREYRKPDVEVFVDVEEKNFDE